MHIFQKHILDQLRRNPSLRYSQLQPDDIESSHFKYHLNQLIKEGSVVQVGRGLYSLSASGKVYVDQLSEGRVNAHATPKVITYTLLYDKDNYYLLRKSKEPYIGLLNMIGGKLHNSESSKDAAKREVHEKTKIVIANPDLHGVAEVRISSDSTLVSHVIAFIFSAGIGHADDASLLTKLSKKSIRSQSEIAPDLVSIIDAIETQKCPFVLDLNLEA